MKPQFSEFTYGFSVTNELVYYFRSNMSQTPIFSQFKLSGFLYSKNAKEIDLFNEP